MATTLPRSDQIEITLIGPGYGECILLHVGSNNWIIIDSCIDSRTGEPAALSYFSKLGVDPSESVRLVIATHWHDDHIRGLSRVLSTCKKAKFCCSVALTRDEFIGMVLDYESRNVIEASSGVREISEIFKALLTRPKQMKVWAIADRPIFSIPKTEIEHEMECRIWALSPSDTQVEKFFLELAALIPKVRETKRRVAIQGPNHVAVVTLINVGDLAILLGSDLEETGDEGTGWSVIVSSKERPQHKASIFKVPHHGSENGHNSDVWDRMVIDDAFAILTPFSRG